MDMFMVLMVVLVSQMYEHVYMCVRIYVYVYCMYNMNSVRCASVCLFSHISLMWGL